MKKSNLFFLTTLIILFFLTLPLFHNQVLAQEPAQESANESEEVSCFDYYKFGSVDVDVSVPTNLYPSGSVVSMVGSVSNPNSYPIIGGSIFLKVYRMDASGDILDNVDFYLAKDNITIGASSTRPIELSWKVPNYAQTGKYKIVTFFTTYKKFNMQGLTFTDDISGGEVSFEVRGETKGGVFFDRSTTTLNNSKYTFSSFSPVVEDDGVPVKISSRLVNTTGVTQQVKVFHDVYKWDTQNVGNFVETVEQNITVQPGKPAPVSVTLPHFDFPVYYVVTRAEYKDEKSILALRYIIKDKQHYRLNFPTFLEFPLEKNKEIPFVTCFHGMGMGGGFADHLDEPAMKGNQKTSKDATFDITVSDMDNNILSTKTFNGVVSDDMKAVMTKFTFPENLDNVRVKVDMKVDGKLYDSVKLSYECGQIDNTLCLKKNDDVGQYQSITGLGLKDLFSNKIIIFILILLFVILSALGLWYVKRKRDVTVVLFLLVGSFIYHDTASAGTMTWTGESHEMCDESIFGRVSNYWGTAGKCNMLTSKVDVTVKNKYYIKNTANGAYLNCGATVSAGTQLEFGYTALVDGDLCWNGTGSHLDTPCGEWNSNGSRIISNICTSENYLKSYAGGDYPSIRAYLQIVGARPDREVRMQAYGGSTCTGNNTGIVRCNTTTATGPVLVKYYVDPTYAKFYTGIVHKGSRDGIPESAVGKCQLTNYGSTRDRPAINQTQYNMSSLPEYKFPIPADSQICQINVTIPNGKPSVDIEDTGDTQCTVGTSVSLTLNSSDPENQNVKYSVDWGLGLPAEIFPASGLYEAPGQRSITKTYTTSGSKTITVVAEDTSGATSSPASTILNCENLCTFKNACGKDVAGVKDGDSCTPPDPSTINNSCIEDFKCSSNAVNANGSVECYWKNATTSSGITTKCSFLDYTPATPRPLPGLQNLDLTQESAQINNIQTTSRFCLVCQFFDASNVLLGEAIQHQWIKVIRVGEE